MKRMNYFTVVIYQEEVSMTNKLQQYFPMIQTEEEVLSEINSRSHLKQMYEEWEEEEQRGFLDFVTGAKGVKMMYDFISKEILNPEIYKERVEEFISLLLGQNVKILEVLPNEETGLSDGYRRGIRKRKYCESGNSKKWIYVSGRTKRLLFGGSIAETVQARVDEK